MTSNQKLDLTSILSEQTWLDIGKPISVPNQEGLFSLNTILQDVVLNNTTNKPLMLEEIDILKKTSRDREEEIEKIIQKYRKLTRYEEAVRYMLSLMRSKRKYIIVNNQGKTRESNFALAIPTYIKERDFARSFPAYNTMERTNLRVEPVVKPEIRIIPKGGNLEKVAKELGFVVVDDDLWLSANLEGPDSEDLADGLGPHLENILIYKKMLAIDEDGDEYQDHQDYQVDTTKYDDSSIKYVQPRGYSEDVFVEDLELVPEFINRDIYDHEIEIKVIAVISPDIE